MTGLGLISCLGNDYGQVGRALKAGQSGVRTMQDWDRPGLHSRVAGTPLGVEQRIEEAALPKLINMGMSVAARWSAVAARDAVADAGLSDEELADYRTGCFVGTGGGDYATIYDALSLYHEGRLRRADPFTVMRAMSSSSSAAVANLLGIKGRSYSLSSACATSAHNIGHGYELIRDGQLDRAIVGGAEEVSDVMAAAFSTMRVALSTHYNDRPAEASRPFDSDRDGFVIGGGAGIVVLEERESALARGAHLHCEVGGFGASSDAYNPVRPDPEGSGAAECMRAAIADADLEPDDVDYVNAHGTATTEGDLAELRSLRRVFGSGAPPFSSTKSTTGHPLGAAGALEMVFCIAMLEGGFLAPSVNVDQPDPEVGDMPLLTETKVGPIHVVLSNSFGFGGTNATLLFRHA